MNFGEYLDRALTLHGKSKYWLSKETGIPKTTIYSIVGRDHNPSIDIVKKIMVALDNNIDNFISEPDDGKRFLDVEQEYKALLIKHKIADKMGALRKNNLEKSAEKWETLTDGLSKSQINELKKYADYLRSQAQ